MRTYAQKHNQPQKPASSNLARANRATPRLNHREHPIIHLQRTIGNQAVLRMLQTHAEESHAVSTATVGDSANVSRQEDSDVVVPPSSEPELNIRVQIVGHEHDDLLVKLHALVVEKKVSHYVPYRNTILTSTEIERRVALNTALLSELRNILNYFSFAKCVELLGRRAPTFNELKKNSVVLAAIQDAWNASDVGVRDLVSQPHEEGGWIYMNLIDGSLSIRRATPTHTNALYLEPPPQVEDSVLVAMFHTHPTLGRRAGPSPHDLVQDKRRGLPNLVVANKGNDRKIYQIYLSGPAARKHLSAPTSIPGPSGGNAP